MKKNVVKIYIFVGIKKIGRENIYILFVKNTFSPMSENKTYLSKKNV